MRVAYITKMRRNPTELRRIDRSATPTDIRRPPGLRTSVGVAERSLAVMLRATLQTLTARENETIYTDTFYSIST